MIWAIGKNNVFSASSDPHMDSTNVALSGQSYAHTATLTSGLTLNWNVVGDALQLQAVYSGVDWIGVGISDTGDMVGPSTARSSVVICNPANKTTMAQTYKVEAASYAGLVPHTYPGVSGVGCVQSDGQTVITYTRKVCV